MLVGEYGESGRERRTVAGDHVSRLMRSRAVNLAARNGRSLVSSADGRLRRPFERVFGVATSDLRRVVAEFFG